MGAYTDGWPGLAVAISQAPKAYPLRKLGDTSHSVHVRRYRQRLSNFVPTAAGTADPLQAGAYLVDESTPEDIGGGMAEFSRTYATIPDATTKPGTTSIARTRPSSIPKSTTAGTLTTYGAETTGNAGLIKQLDGDGTAFELHTRRAVASDTGVITSPSGGSFAIVATGFGTASGIAYNASAATIKTALATAVGSTVTWSDVVASDDSGYQFACAASMLLPVGTTTAGGMITSVAGSLPLNVVNVQHQFNATADGFVEFDLSAIVCTPEVYGAGWTRSLYEPVKTGEYLASDNFNPTLRSRYVALLPEIHKYVHTSGVVDYRTAPITGGTIRVRVKKYAGDSWTYSSAIPISFADPQGMASALNAAINATLGTTRSGHTKCTAASIIRSTVTWTAEFGGSQSNDVFLFTPLYIEYVQAPAPATYSFTFGWSGALVTVDQTSTQASVQAALNALTVLSTRGHTVTVTAWTKDAYGIKAQITFPPVAIVVTSSVTPSPSTVRQIARGITTQPQVGSYGYGTQYLYYTYFGITVGVTERRIVTAAAHGMKAGDSLWANFGGAYTFGILRFSVVDEKTLLVLNTEAPWNSATLVTELGKLASTWTVGATVQPCKIITEYWLPGVSPGITTAEDIPPQQAAPSDSATLDAIMTSGSAYIPAEVGEVSEYLGAIIKRETKWIKIK